MVFRLFSILLLWSLVSFKNTQVYSAEESFLLINGVTDQVVVEVGPHINQRISPCSTFKIPLSLMGYDAGILKDADTPVWHFQDDYDSCFEGWKTSHSPQLWIKNSCVWYAKLLAIELGLEKVTNYLALFDYGNQNVSGGLVQPGSMNPPWINSSLEISPREQVVFIQKMIQGRLSLSKHSVEMTRAICFIEELPEGSLLFGKTGWSGSEITKDGQTVEHSWFVGWIENDEFFFPFAYLIREKKINLKQRIPRVKQLLVEALFFSITTQAL